MKKILTIALLALSMGVQAQTKVTKDANGNYVAVKADTTENKATGATFTDSKGNVYPLFKGAKGGLYYNRISAKGNKYKVYIKEA